MQNRKEEEGEEEGEEEEEDEEQQQQQDFRAGRTTPATVRLLRHKKSIHRRIERGRIRERDAVCPKRMSIWPI